MEGVRERAQVEKCLRTTSFSPLQTILRNLALIPIAMACFKQMGIQICLMIKKKKSFTLTRKWIVMKKDTGLWSASDHKE